MKNNDVMKTASEKIKVHKAKSRWYKAMSAVACMVVLCTVYSLILPAITLEASAENPFDGHTLYCQLSEHAHTDECVEQTLTCEETEDPGHTHGDDCYSPLLICELPLQTRHTHRDSCYKTESQLTCELEECEEHTHTEECVGTQLQLTCQLAETEGHRHTEECNGTKRQLACQQEESAGHSHTESCKTVEKQLTCTTAMEDPTHVHTEGYEGCYQMLGTDELICGQDGVEGHTHVDDCYKREPWFHNCTLHVHSSEDGCYTAVETITCGMEESAGHAHADDCYVDAEIIICGKEETAGHAHGDTCYTDVQVTMCEKAETEGHAHSDSCYTDVQVANCGLTEMAEDHTEHVATCYDYEQTQLTCELEESQPSGHTHEDDCYETATVCEIEEHIHEKNCTIDVESDDWVWLDGEKYREVLMEKTNMYVDMLPTYQEFEEKLSEFESNEDWDGYEAYYQEIFDKIFTAYTFYAEHEEDAYSQIINLNRLDDLSNIVLSQTYALSSRYTVNMINTGYANSTHNYSVIVVGGKKGSTIGNAIGSFGYQWWSCVVVDGNGIVTKVIGMGDSLDKTNVAIPTNGYAILRHGYSLDAVIGDRVVLTGDLATYDLSSASVKNHSSSGYGTIAFDDDAQPKYKEAADYPGFNEATQSYSLTPIENNLSTIGKIKINLYNYGNDINDRYDADKTMPGFQQGLGVRSSIGTSLTSGEMNFGDNIATEMAMGQYSSVTAASTAIGINRTDKYFDDEYTGTGNGTTEYGSANLPIQGEMQYTIGNDGFPVMADGTSLKHLFSSSPADSVTWVNGTGNNADNIDGLFKIYNNPSNPNDPYNGNYYFDSRDNFAQYNPTTNRMDLYAEYLTPNWIMYPFGNFLPFNDINTQTTRVADLDADDMSRQASWASYNTTVYPTLADHYSNASSRLYEFADISKSRISSDWSGFDATDEYFGLLSSLPDDAVNDTDKQAMANAMYNIDFDEATDFFFGMSIEMYFMQPKDGYYRDEGEIVENRDAMRFNFAGDDDVWIYIDGDLFLDLTGIHRHVGGEINFQNGTVTYRALDPATGDVTNVVKTYTFREIMAKAGKTEAEINELLNETGTFNDYSNHHFKMFYMERGSGSSVCRINFNMPLIHENTIGVMKQVEVIDENGDSTYNPSYLGNQEYKFRVLAVDENGNKTTTPFVEEGTDYEIYDLNSVKVGEGKVDANGIITLKANQVAQIKAPENGGKYYIRELIPSDIIVDTGKEDDYSTLVYVDVMGQYQLADIVSGFPMIAGFVGFDSPILDISSGNTVFTYLNKYRIDKVGHLAVEKTVTEPTDYLKNLDPIYEFEITLDGQPLPAGTTYTVNNLRDGETANRTVNINAQGKSTISIKYGQTAKIDSGILPGSVFTVRELNTAGYTVTYPADYKATDSTGDYATGTILPVSANGNQGDTTVAVTVNNTEYDTTFELPVTKLLNSFDGKSHKFSFKLEQVNEDGTAVNTSYKLIDEIVIDVNTDADSNGVGEGAGKFSCELSYNKMIGAGYTFPATVWLKITETAGTEADVAYDESYFMTQVEIDYNNTTNTMSSRVLSVEHYVNGTPTAETEDASNISFTNDMLDTLKVSKTVVGGSQDSEFTFTLAVTNGTEAFTDTLAWSKTPVKDGESPSGTMSVENGLYTFTLRHGQTITIDNLPIGAVYTVTETNGDGYYPAYRINSSEEYSSGTVASGTLTWIVDNAQVTDHVEFENRAGSQLPHTGGTGTTLYTSGGVLLMGASLILGYAIKKRKNYNN